MHCMARRICSILIPDPAVKPATSCYIGGHERVGRALHCLEQSGTSWIHRMGMSERCVNWLPYRADCLQASACLRNSWHAVVERRGASRWLGCRLLRKRQSIGPLASRPDVTKPQRASLRMGLYGNSHRMTRPCRSAFNIPCRNQLYGLPRLAANHAVPDLSYRGRPDVSVILTFHGSRASSFSSVSAVGDVLSTCCR